MLSRSCVVFVRTTNSVLEDPPMKKVVLPVLVMALCVIAVLQWSNRAAVAADFNPPLAAPDFTHTAASDWINSGPLKALGSAYP